MLVTIYIVTVEFSTLISGLSLRMGANLNHLLRHMNMCDSYPDPVTNHSQLSNNNCVLSIYLYKYKVYKYAKMTKILDFGYEKQQFTLKSYNESGAKVEFCCNIQLWLMLIFFSVIYFYKLISTKLMELSDVDWSCY